MSSRKIKNPKYKIGDVIQYDDGNLTDIVSGFQWFDGVYKYYLMCDPQQATVDETYITKKIGEVEFDN